MLSRRAVARLLAVLTAAAGSLDVFCVTQLGGAFASIITGNMVQFGRAIVAVDGALAAGVATAVSGYALGVAVGAVGLRRHAAGWRRRTTLIVGLEVLLLAAVAVGWRATDGLPGTATTLTLLAMAATAMGIQSAITLATGMRGVSTTYLTGTLTNLVRTLAVDPHRFATATGGAIRLAALLCGAIASAALLRLVPAWAPALPAALVAVVAIAAVTAGGRREARRR